MSILRLVVTVFVVASVMPVFAASQAAAQGDGGSIATGNVVFIHPDGTGASMWGALRDYAYGPDSVCYWDMMQRMGLYRSHVLNSTNASSHGGATVHSFGVKVKFDTYGNVPENPVMSLSGESYSIMTEAQKAGMATALVNSGHICEPGTGVFVANAAQRSNTDLISAQVIHSGVDIILSGGEKLLLPEGVMGRHGVAGVRTDDRNLIEEARDLGYLVVFTRDELLAVPSDTRRVLGVFASKHTFNDYPEEYLKEHGLPLYYDYAPTVGEMTKVALRLLENTGRQFFMVVEEEGTDNFANSNNAAGTLTALQRADEAIKVAMGFIADNPNTLLITAADSDAGGMQLYSIRDEDEFTQPLPAVTDNGAPLDGIDGTGSIPFVAAPDKRGVRFRFGIAWSCYKDVAGAVIARAHGLNAELLEPNVDNTDIYRIMYATLFGRVLPEYNSAMKP